MTVKKWEVSDPNKKKLDQPEGPPAYYLDAYAAGDTEKARRIWSKFGSRVKNVHEIDERAWPSSWNWSPISLVAALLAETDKGPWVEKLLRYSRRQLNRDPVKHDLWGQETLSRIYSWPPAVIALAYDWAAANNEKLAGHLKDLATAHAYTLALFALPDPHPDSPVKELMICAPGMRSIKSEVGEQISFITASILKLEPNFIKGANPKQTPSWARRVAAVATHDYLGDDERQLLREHVRSGRNAAAIVDKLNALGVELRTPVQAWRYASGDFLGLAMRNVQGSTPPIMAMSRIDGIYRDLTVHPKDLRGEGGHSLGNPSRCWREADRVHAVFENAVTRKGGLPETLKDAMPAPLEDQTILYAVRIGQKSDTGTSVQLLTPEARREVVLGDAGIIRDLAADKPDKGIFRHGQAIGKIASQGRPNVEQIYRHARAIGRLEPREDPQETIHRRAQHLVDAFEWWW